MEYLIALINEANPYRSITHSLIESNINRGHIVSHHKENARIYNDEKGRRLVLEAYHINSNKDDRYCYSVCV